MKRSAMVSAWVLATALAVGIGIGAVQLAGAQVNDDPIQPLSADEVPTQPSPSEVAASEDPATGSTATTATAAPSTTVPETSTSTSPAGPTPVPATTSPSTAPAPTSAAPTTSALAVTSSSSTIPSTTTPTTIAPQSQVTVHQLIGGSLSIEASPGVVDLVWATPNGGFVVDIESRGPTNVEVDFESGTHKSRFRAEWSGGVLDVELREEAED